MSFNASSYFAGVGTVVVVMAVGFGAGIHMTGFFNDPYQPNRLERRAAGTPEKPVDDFTRVEIKAPVDVKSPETKTIAAGSPSVTAPEPPKTTAQAEPAPMAPSQRMRQSFDWQPRASQSSAPQTPQATQPPSAALPVAAAPAQETSAPTDTNAELRDGEAAKAKADQNKADQKKAQQRKLAADRRRERERQARLNAAAEWLRNQPADVYAGSRDAYAQPRFTRDYFARW